MEPHEMSRDHLIAEVLQLRARVAVLTAAAAAANAAYRVATAPAAGSAAAARPLSSTALGYARLSLQARVDRVALSEHVAHAELPPAEPNAAAAADDANAVRLLPEGSGYAKGAKVGHAFAAKPKAAPQRAAKAALVSSSNRPQRWAVLATKEKQKKAARRAAGAGSGDSDADADADAGSGGDDGAGAGAAASDSEADRSGKRRKKPVDEVLESLLHRVPKRTKPGPPRHAPTDTAAAAGGGGGNLTLGMLADASRASADPAARIAATATLATATGGSGNGNGSGAAGGSLRRAIKSAGPSAALTSSDKKSPNKSGAAMPAATAAAGGDGAHSVDSDDDPDAVPAEEREPDHWPSKPERDIPSGAGGGAGGGGGNAEGTGAASGSGVGRKRARDSSAMVPAVAYTNLILWHSVPDKLQWLRSHMAHQTPSTLVEVRRIRDARHPCNGQRGLFARRDIAAHKLVINYAGVVRIRERRDGKLQSYSNSKYILELADIPDFKNTTDYDLEYSVEIDASKAGNESRFINDSRGTDKAANVRFQRLFDQWTGELMVFVETTRDIRAGEELLIGYGHDFWRAVTTNESIDAAGAGDHSATDDDDDGSDDEFVPSRAKRKGKRSRAAARKLAADG